MKRTDVSGVNKQNPKGKIDAAKLAAGENTKVKSSADATFPSRW